MSSTSTSPKPPSADFLTKVGTFNRLIYTEADLLSIIRITENHQIRRRKNNRHLTAPLTTIRVSPSRAARRVLRHRPHRRQTLIEAMAGVVRVDRDGGGVRGTYEGVGG